MANEPEPDPTREQDAGSAPAGTVPVVELCSSAGGLDALTRFFKATPSTSGVAFVVVPHLDPTHESMMVELLSKHTTMSVSEVRGGTMIQPDLVFVIPPNKNLSIRGGVMELSEPIEPRGTRTAIDAFLSSLAIDQRERAIAIVLSGTGSHGTLGIKEIKRAGGMVMAQEPESAGHDAMPRSAIADGHGRLRPRARRDARRLARVRAPSLQRRQAGPGGSRRGAGEASPNPRDRSRANEVRPSLLSQEDAASPCAASDGTPPALSTNSRTS